MHIPKFRFFLGLLSLYLLCTATPAFASYSEIFFGFKYAFVIGLVIALPSGLLCGMAELFGIRHRPPLWLGWGALILVIYGLENVLNGLEAGHGKNFVLLYPIPALMSLALVSLLPAPRWRLITTWCIAIGFTWLIVLKAHQSKPADDRVGLVLGGALVSMLMWQVAFEIGQRKSRRAGIPSVQSE